MKIALFHEGAPRARGGGGGSKKQLGRQGSMQPDRAPRQESPACTISSHVAAKQSDDRAGGKMLAAACRVSAK